MGLEIKVDQYGKSMTEWSSTLPCTGCSEHGAEHEGNRLVGELQLQVCVRLLLVLQQPCLARALTAPRLSRNIRNRWNGTAGQRAPGDYYSGVLEVIARHKMWRALERAEKIKVSQQHVTDDVVSSSLVGHLDLAVQTWSCFSSFTFSVLVGFAFILFFSITFKVLLQECFPPAHAVR